MTNKIDLLKKEIMKSYKYNKPEKPITNRVVLKSYTKKISNFRKIIFSKPSIIIVCGSLFLSSTYFLITAFSQVVEASNSEVNKIFRLYTVKNDTLQSGINYKANQEVLEQQKYTVYTVTSGDNFTKISQKTKNSLEEILSYNDIAINSVLRVGQNLKVQIK